MNPLYSLSQIVTPEHSGTPLAEFGPLRLTIGRWSTNELVLFDRAAKESWIIYPPRSAYEFLGLRRRDPHGCLIEHHPWAPFTAPVDHELLARSACVEHGLECPAQIALQAAIELGFDPWARSA